MEQGPFEQVRRITTDLLSDRHHLRGLIAVLSKHSSPDVLLVYVWTAMEATGLGRRAVTADGLRDVDLADYAGPTIGFAAIDLIRPEIGTKGQHFVRLDRILRKNGHSEVLRETWSDLADYLEQKAEQWLDEEQRVRARAEIAAIRAPAKVAQLSPERRRGLIAFLPASGRAICLDDGPLDYLVARLAESGEALITFEEIRTLIEASSYRNEPDRYPVELRTILRRGSLEEGLVETRHELARLFFQRWRRSGDELVECQRAYAIALEGRLAHRDVDDLVAVIPSDDFEAFLTRGTGIYVYRRAFERVVDGADPGVDHRYLFDGDVLENFSQPGSPIVFSLLPLQDLSSSAATWCDLGPPMRRSGRTEILARNAWMLVEDLLDSREHWNRLRVTPTKLYETMARCSVIFSLTDPWRTRQARRDKWVQELYRTLDGINGLLSGTASTPSTRYHAALRLWYGCALLHRDAEVEDALNEMVDLLSRQPGDSTDWSEGAARTAATDLKNMALGLWQLLRGGGLAERYENLKAPMVESIPQVVRRATEMAEPMPLLSVPFGGSFREYAAIHDRIHALTTATVPVQYKIEGLANQADLLRHWRRQIFAPQHEARVLETLYDRTLKKTEDLIAELRGGAAFEFELLTPSVFMDEESGIMLAIHNIGNVEAIDVELELDASESFELLDVTFKQSVARLAPSEQEKFRFRIKCSTEDERFPIRCTVSWTDSNPTASAAGAAMGERPTERKQRTYDSRVEIEGVGRAPFRTKPNPYVFGVHVEEHRHFYGRRSELNELLSHLAGRRPQNILIRAPRRAGKTSLLYMVRAVLSDTDRSRGARDWFELPAAWDAALNETVPVLLNLQGVQALQTGMPTPSAFHHAVLGALREAGMRSSSVDTLLSEPVISFTQFTRGMNEVVRAAGGRRPVILVDEFDILDTMQDKVGFYGLLRTAVASIQKVTWIVASAMGLYKELRDYASPLFNIFKITPMGRIDTEAARQLVLSPWETGGSHQDASLNIVGDAVETIIDEAGNYPYFIQLLCSSTIDYVNAMHSNRVSFATVQHVIEKQLMLKQGAANLYFDFMWEGSGPSGRLLMLTLLYSHSSMNAEELKNAALRILDRRDRSALAGCLLANFDDSLRRLTYMDALRNTSGSGYTFSIPIFRRLLVRRSEGEDLEGAVIDELAATEPEHD